MMDRQEREALVARMKLDLGTGWLIGGGLTLVGHRSPRVKAAVYAGLSLVMAAGSFAAMREGR